MREVRVGAVALYSVLGLCALCLSITPRALAQPVSVSGIVTDELTGEPLEGIEVRIGVPGATRARAVTDALGRFAFAFESGATRFDVLVDVTEEYLPVRLESIEPDGSIEVRLTPRVCTLEGTVTDAATLAAVPYAWLSLSDGRTDLVRAQADAGGHYCIPVDVWQTQEPVGRNRLRTGLSLSLAQKGYLPQTLRNLDLQRYAYSPSPCPLEVLAEPYLGTVLVEAFEANSRRPAAGMFLTYGCGPRYMGQVVTDGFGQALVRVPAWRHRSRPIELNEPITEVWIMHAGQQYVAVRAAGIDPRATQAPGLADDTQALQRLCPRVRFSMAPPESKTTRSSFLIGHADDYSIAPSAPSEAVAPRAPTTPMPPRHHTEEGDLQV